MPVHAQVKKRRDQLIQYRRHFHKHPELSFQEFKTAQFIVDKVKQITPPVSTKIGIGKTGIVVLVSGTKQGTPHQSSKCIAIRADMDALPIKESVKREYCSSNEGVMHACGHDAHMSMALVALESLCEIRDSFCGSAKFIFQPAEEGLGGAEAMIKDGVLLNPNVDQIYGLHVWNYLPSGVIGIKHGDLMASAGEFLIDIVGKGGHGAAPQGTRDVIVAGANLVNQLHTIVSRNVSPLESAVCTVGTFNAGYRSNVIADNAHITGTLRAFNDAVYANLVVRMQNICDGIAQSFDLQVKFTHKPGYPVTRNLSPEHVEHIAAAARLVVSEDCIRHIEPTMASEDFSYFLQERKGCFFFLGSHPSVTSKDTADSDQLNSHPHHKSNFDISESILEIGASLWVNLVLQQLS